MSRLAGRLLEKDPTLLTEKDLQSLVIDLARLYKWKTYHTFDSRRSASGFPDLVMVHPVRGVIFVELKREDGKVSAKQQEWIDALRVALQLAFVWRPSSWPEIVRVLTGQTA